MEDKYKRRLREWKRRVVTTLTDQGFRVKDHGEPFHLLAVRGKSGQFIRICFHYVTEDEASRVHKEPVPLGCRKVIWQIDERGKSHVEVKVS